MGRLLSQFRYLLMAIAVIPVTIALLYLQRESHVPVQRRTPFAIKHHAEIEEAVRGLLESNERMRYLVISDSVSKKCVVFLPVTRTSVFVGLSREELSEVEHFRTKALFSNRQLVSDKSYTTHLEGTDQAADFAVQVFEKVYQLPPETKLSIRKNY